jgi:hypothetical protein
MAQQLGPENSFVQVATDGSGKKILNVPVTMQVADAALGTVVETVYVQATVLVDSEGRIVERDTSYQEDMLRELRAIVTGLSILTNQNLYER